VEGLAKGNVSQCGINESNAAEVLRAFMNGERLTLTTELLLCF
jgi:hypothetical protein